MSILAAGWLAQWVLQTWGVPEPADVDVTLGLGGSAIGTFVTTLVVGAIMIAIAPAYVERMMEDVTDEPIDTFVYGILALVVLTVVTLLLFITIVGILVIIPLVLLAGLVWAIGAAIAFLAIADRLVDQDGEWLVALLLAAGMNGGLALTGIGGIVSLCVGAAGFGAVLRDQFG